MNESQVIYMMGKPDYIQYDSDEFEYCYKWRDKHDLVVYFDIRTSRVTSTGAVTYP
jgi:hypothetical protein